MKKAIFTILFITLAGFIFAGNEGDHAKVTPNTPAEPVTLSGTVVDFNSGEALAGVEVKLEGTDIKTYTDFDGQFEIKDVKPGQYNVIASYISYKNSLVENFKADNSKNQVDIKLQGEK